MNGVSFENLCIVIHVSNKALLSRRGKELLQIKKTKTMINKAKDLNTHFVREAIQRGNSVLVFGQH